MPRRPSLADHERSTITRHREDGLSLQQIAEAVGRPKTVIWAYLKDPEGYGTKKSPGRPPLLSKRTKSLILRLASTGKMSAKEIKAATKVTVTVRQVQRLISGCPHLNQYQLFCPPVSSILAQLAVHVHRRSASMLSLSEGHAVRRACILTLLSSRSQQCPSRHAAC